MNKNTTIIDKNLLNICNKLIFVGEKIFNKNSNKYKICLFS